MREYIQDFAMDKNMSENQLKANMNHSPQLKEEFLNYVEQRRKEKGMEKTPTFTVKKRDNAPDFVFGYFGCKFEDLKKYVNSKGYVNFDILQSKEGGYYVKVSNYGLTTDTVAQETVTESDTVLNFNDEEIPF